MKKSSIFGIYKFVYIWRIFVVYVMKTVTNMEDSFFEGMKFFFLCNKLFLKCNLFIFEYYLLFINFNLFSTFKFFV